MTEREESKKKIINRLRTIKGHVQGIEKMVEEDKGCEDVLVQIAAIKQSIHKVGLAIMEQQASSCFSLDDHVDKEKMEELIRLMFNYSK
ncbi:metal-sensitive transcriptional regulator [Fusibacter tunisiensis]|uniref:DNA-binding FrmR family transcriptional regulator n=1 Tax=Fusibacter tunisiensis TaxID=1008308 RepID=A0ABS2MR10_9FIRM|nr:metal-sensitive transcriptional regulator [Fusibacter tunisiensis]MBM7561853.1 DNA-binding FrmR family transcriptional regulator [Fusibacter tunisiensis]